MDDVDLLPYEDVPEDRKKGEDGGKGCRAVDDKEGNVVDLEAIGEVAYAFTVVVGVCYDNDLVAPVNEPLGELIDVALDSSWLRKEEVADHSDVVCWLGHFGGIPMSCRVMLTGFPLTMRLSPMKRWYLNSGRS